MGASLIGRLVAGGGRAAQLGGVFLLVVLLYAALMSYPNVRAEFGNTHRELANLLGRFGVLTLGVGLVIIVGGIDLSIGSVVVLGGVCFGLLLKAGWHPALACLAVVVGGGAIGLGHGLLVTRVGLQPFLVTLCGFFAYRGMAKQLSLEEVNLPRSPEFKYLHDLATGTGDSSGVSGQLIALLLIAAVLAVVLHGSVYGRYLYAIGANEPAARYAGIATTPYKIAAYMACSALAAFGGTLELLETYSISPSTGASSYELYAITGAVLGGCSLAGGAGNVLGMLLGTAVLPLVRTLIVTAEIKSETEYTIMGGALLAGTLADTLLNRKRRKEG